MRRRKATDTELRSLSAKMDDPSRHVLCPTCGNEITYTENPHGRMSACEKCHIMTAERGI